MEEQQHTDEDLRLAHVARTLISLAGRAVDEAKQNINGIRDPELRQQLEALVPAQS